MAFFGLKLGLDLEMWAAHPNQKFQGVPPGIYNLYRTVINRKENIHTKFAIYLSKDYETESIE